MLCECSNMSCYLKANKGTLRIEESMRWSLTWGASTGLTHYVNHELYIVRLPLASSFVPTPAHTHSAFVTAGDLDR